MITKRKYNTNTKTKKNKHNNKINSKISNIRTKKDTNNHNSISVLSYNISWESMSGAKKDWALCSNNTNPKNPMHVSVCVSNIGKVINENPTDFITLQEATEYKKLLRECPRLHKMQYNVHTSGLDVVVTFWDNKYKIIDSVEGEFEKGRPWMATIFTNGICLINVHFGHYDSQEEYSKMVNMIKTINARIKIINARIKTINARIKKTNKENKENIIQCNRYIISGDFNYDIKDLAGGKGIIILDDIKFYHHHKHMLTCCISRRRHYDHVIDSYKTPKDIIIPDVEYMASDHKPIIGKLLIQMDKYV